MSPQVPPEVADLLARSNRLGADPRNTNYAGGNTSAKGTETDPVTGAAGRAAVGQGLRRRPGHADRAGLAVLRLDRLRALVGVYPGVEREDEMVAAFDYCLHGQGGAAPSIDTAMHGLVDAAHVDHLHPDAGIALATAADGEELTRSASATRSPGCRGGGRVSSSGWTSPRSSRPARTRSACILGGHGITAWGATSEECEAQLAGDHRDGAAVHRRRTVSAEPFGRVLAGFAPLPEAERRARAAALAPVLRGLASTDRPRSGTSPTARRCWTSWRAEHPAAGRARHVLP